MDWVVFDTFNLSRFDDDDIRWENLNHWIDLARHEVSRIADERDKLVMEWDRLLRDLGGDPSRCAWFDFRPLRLSREEDWSDWLAHLIERSKSGRFAQQLLGAELAGERDFTAPLVEREMPVSDGERRADLVITWRGGAKTHVEVKIWDESFKKTFDTAEKLEKGDVEATGVLSHFILLPPSSRGTWRSVAESENQEGLPTVWEISWTDVAVALRTALRSREEETPWNVWAWSFIGAVEQKILGCPRTRRCEDRADKHGSLSILGQIVQQAEIMRRALGHG
jgi:hypothetical protein